MSTIDTALGGMGSAVLSTPQRRTGAAYLGRGLPAGPCMGGSRGLGLSSTIGGFSKGLSCGVRIHTNRMGVVIAWHGPGLVQSLARMVYRLRLGVLNTSMCADAHVYRMTGAFMRRVCLRSKKNQIRET